MSDHTFAPDSYENSKTGYPLISENIMRNKTQKPCQRSSPFTDVCACVQLLAGDALCVLCLLVTCIAGVLGEVILTLEVHSSRGAIHGLTGTGLLLVFIGRTLVDSQGILLLCIFYNHPEVVVGYAELRWLR